MAEIKLESVLEKVIESHYGSIDWSLIDALGIHKVPGVYGVQSFITYAQFKNYVQAGGFIASRDTVASKWIALTGADIFLLQTGKKEKTAYIDLTAVKIAVPKWNRVPFDVKAYTDAVDYVRVRSARVTGAEQEVSE